MNRPVNPLRGESELVVNGTTYLLRPTFACLVAVEEEIGSLFGLVERAAGGALTLEEIAALLWHCLPFEERPSREAVGQAVIAMGMVAATKPVRSILTQVLQGRS